MKKKVWSRSYIKNRTFLRTMLISIVTLICIPLVLVQILLIKQFADDFDTTNAESYQSALRINAESFQSQIDLLSYNAVKISLDSTVGLPGSESVSDYSMKLAADAVKNYGIGLPLSAAVGVYYRVNDCFIYNGNKKTLETICDAIRITDVQKRECLVALMQEVGNIELFATDAYGCERILIAKAVRIRSVGTDDGVVFFVIENRKLLDIYQSNLPAQTGFAILNAAGSPLVSNRNFPHEMLEEPSFLEFLRSGDNLFETRINRIHTCIYKYVDNDGRIFLAAVAQSVAQEPIKGYLIRAGLIILLSCVALYILLMVVLKINYKPIKQMVAKYSTDEDASLLPELERIDLAFSTKSKENANQRTILAGIVLGELVYGGETDEKLLKKIFGKGQFQKFAVATVVSNQLSTTEVESVLEHIREKLPELEVYSTSVPSRPHILYIFLARDEEALTDIKTITAQSVHAVTGEACEVRVGESVEKLEDIQTSYYSSLMLDSDHAGEQRTDAITAAYPLQEIQHFLQFVVLGDADRAIEQLERIAEQLDSVSTSFARRRFNYYRFLYSYLNVVRENFEPISENDIDMMLDFRNPKHAFDVIRKTVKDCCGKMVRDEENTDSEKRAELIAWIDAHLTDLELRLTTVAEALDISPYAVSRLFKESVGEGFKEYVVRRRLEIAYSLLQTTDQSVTDIALQVGYENATYFSTTFKKQYGVPPSKIRGTTGKTK